MKLDHKAAYEYVPPEPDPTKELEHRFDAFARETRDTLARIVAALFRIEQGLEARSLFVEDINARIDRTEIHELELRKQVDALTHPPKPTPKRKRKK